MSGNQDAIPVDTAIKPTIKRQIITFGENYIRPFFVARVLKTPF